VIRETAIRQCFAKGIDLAEVQNLFWSEDLPRMNQPGHIDALRRQLTGDGIEVVVIDPAYLALPSNDQGNLFVVGEMLSELSEACRECGTTLILCHHTKRGIINPFDPPELEDIAWAGYQEFARQWLLLSRREKYEPGTGEHRLWLSAGGSAGHGGLWGLDIAEGHGYGNRKWELSVMPAADVRQAFEDQREQAKEQKRDKQADSDVDAIVKACARLTGHKGTVTDIRTRAGLNSQRFNVALAAALDQRRMRQCAEQITKANKHSYDAFEVVDPE
jgi:hypothetical protein